METQNTQSPDFREKLIIGASFERQKAKRIPWRKDFIDRPGVLLTVSGTGEIFFEDAHQQLTAGDLVLYDPLPQHLFAGDPEWNFYWFHLPESILKEYRRTPYNTEVPGVRLAHFEKQAFCRIRLEVQEAYSRRTGKSSRNCCSASFSAGRSTALTPDCGKWNLR